MVRYVPLVLALLAAIFLVAPMAIIVPMSFSKAISFEFPPPGYWTGYYAQYFGSESWLDATANSFIIAFGSMIFTLLVALPAAFGFVRYRFRGKGALNLLMMLPVIGVYWPKAECQLPQERIFAPSGNSRTTS